LSIEDSASDALLIRETLLEARYLAWDLPRFELRRVDTLADGLARLDAGGVDVVLCDLDLPDSRAEETFGRVHAHAPHVPIVVLTGREDEALARRTVRAGAEDYLFKRELSGSLLAHALIYAIERREHRQALQKAHDQLERRVQARTVELAQLNQELQAEIVEHERTERALLEVHGQLWGIMLYSSALITVIDQEGRYLLANRAAAEVVGLPEAQMVGKTLAELLPREAAELFLQRLTQVLETQTSLEVEDRFDVDGQERIYTTILSPLFDQEGQPYAVCGIATDVTERKQAVAALRESEALLGQILHQMPYPVEVSDPHGTATMVNPAFLRLFELASADAVVGRYNVFQDPFVMEELGLREEIRRVYEGEVVFMPELRMPVERLGKKQPARKEGSAIHEVTMFPVLGASGDVWRVVTIWQDVTERKHAERKLARYARDLARSNAELERFAHVVSHDLQEPLRTVSSFLDLLERRYVEQLEAEAQELVACASGGAQRMQKMIRALLNLSRVTTRGQDLAPVESEEALDWALAALQRAIDDTQAMVTSTALPRVMADERQLAQVFQNLVANAIKFQAGAAPEVHVSARRQGDEWVLAVRDNGIGIAPEQRAQIFEIFQRGHARDDYPGEGVGLALCQRIVERHGGRIWVESEPGEGSTFYFTLAAVE
jgi:PAS domain S-box-containing protein